MKTFNIKCSPQGHPTTTKCLASILVKHKKPKHANGKKTVRFNLQGAVSLSKKSKLNEYMNGLQTRNIKDFLRSQSCINFKTRIPKCQKFYKGAEYLWGSPPLSMTNCNTNSGSNHCKEVYTGIDMSTPKNNLNDIASLPFGKEEERFPDGSCDNCSIRASHSEGNIYNSPDTFRPNDFSGLNKNREHPSHGLRLEEEKEHEIDNVSPSRNFLSILIKDLSNVTMGGPASQKALEMKFMSRESQDGETSCSVPPNSPLITSPMEEEEEDGPCWESTCLKTNLNNNNENLFVYNMNNNAYSGSGENDSNDNNDNEADPYDENDLSTHMDRRDSPSVPASMICHCTDNVQEQVLRHSMHDVNSRSITDGLPDEAFLRCPILNCGLYFDDMDEFNSHILQLDHNPCKPWASLPNGVLPPVKCFLCPMCGLTYQEPEMCHAHMQAANHLPLMSPLPVRVFACPQCLSFFPSPGHAQEHIEILAHDSFALTFKDDANRLTKAVPIPVPDRVVDIVTRLCDEVPHSLFCLESQEAVTSVDQLIYLINNKHLVFAKSAKSITDVVSNLVTDQACADCLQMVIGCPCSSLCIHASCPTKGPVLAIEARSLCSFIRRCGIADTDTLHEQSPDWLTTVAEADLPTRSNTSSEAWSQSDEQSPDFEMALSADVSVLENVPCADANVAYHLPVTRPLYEHWVVSSVVDSSQSCSHNDPGDGEIVTSAFPSSATIITEGRLPLESESHLLVHVDESVDSMESNHENVFPSNRNLEYNENYPIRASSVSVLSETPSSIRLPRDRQVWSNTVYKPEVIGHKTLLYPVNAIPSIVAQDHSGRLNMHRTLAYRRYPEGYCYRTNCKQRDNINLSGLEDMESQAGANSYLDVEDNNNMYSFLTDSHLAVEDRNGFGWPDRFESLYCLTHPETSPPAPYHENGRVGLLHCLTTPETSPQVPYENGWAGKLYCLATPQTSPQFPYEKNRAGNTFENNLPEREGVQRKNNKNQSRSRKRKWNISSAASARGNKHDEEEDDGYAFNDDWGKGERPARRIVRTHKNMWRNEKESRRSNVEPSANLSVKYNESSSAYRVISRRDETTQCPSKVLVVENMTEGIRTNFTNNFDTEYQTLDHVSEQHSSKTDTEYQTLDHVSEQHSSKTDTEYQTLNHTSEQHSSKTNILQSSWNFSRCPMDGSEENLLTGAKDLALDSEYKNPIRKFNDVAKHGEEECSDGVADRQPVSHLDRWRIVGSRHDRSSTSLTEGIESCVVDDSVKWRETRSFSPSMTERLSPRLKVSPHNTDTCSLKGAETAMLSSSGEDISCSLTGERDRFSCADRETQLPEEQKRVVGEIILDDTKKVEETMSTSDLDGLRRESSKDLHGKAQWQSLEARYPFLIEWHPLC